MPSTEGVGTERRPRPAVATLRLPDVLDRWPRRIVDRLDAGGAWLVLAAGLAIFAALDLWLTRGTTLFVDEQFEFVQNQGLHPSALLAPLNGHLVLLERLMYALDFKLFGPSFVLPRLVEIAGVTLVVCSLFVFVKRRVGAAAALAPAMLVLFFGSAWEQDLVTSGIGGHIYSVAGGLAAFLALERYDPRSTTRTRRDVFACASLTVAVAAFTLGVPFAIGALVLILMQPDARRRVWVALIPLALYAAWQLWVRAVYVPAHGEVDYLAASNILVIPNFIAEELSSTLGALAGLNNVGQPPSFTPAFSTTSDFGPVLAALFVGAVVVRFRRAGVRSPSLWAIVSALLVYWVVLGLASGGGRNPTTVREIYGAAILLLLIAAEAARGLRLSPRAIGVLYLITVLALCGNLFRLREGAHFYRAFATSLRGQLTAIELARGHVSPDYSLNTKHVLEYIAAGQYLAAVDRNGSPAYSLSELLRQPESVRHDADAVLAQALRIAVSPQVPGESVGSCQQLKGTSGGHLTFPLGPPGVALSSPTFAYVGVRKFASQSNVLVGILSPARRADLRIPTDRSARPWLVTIIPAPRSLTACHLRASP